MKNTKFGYRCIIKDDAFHFPLGRVSKEGKLSIPFEVVVHKNYEESMTDVMMKAALKNFFDSLCGNFYKETEECQNVT